MVQVKLFNERGDDVPYEYDPVTANMSEVNAMIDRLEAENHGRAFSLTSGQEVTKATRETEDVVIVRPLAGG